MRSIPVISPFGKQRQKDQKFGYSALYREPEEILGQGRARGKRERKRKGRGRRRGRKRGNVAPFYWKNAKLPPILLSIAIQNIGT